MKRKDRLDKKKEKSQGRKYLRMPENPVFLLEGVVLIGVIAYLFYDSPIAAVFLTPLLYPYYKRRAREKMQQDKKELSAQFREALAAIITALKAGYSAENAFIECLREMQFQFGEKAMITREMKRIGKGIENRIPLEKLLAEFASRWQIEEISEFAEVFSIARRSGGNLPEILGRTAEIIRGRMEIDTEIDILLSSRKFEQKIMDGVPFFIIFYLGLSTDGFFSVLYHNLPGVQNGGEAMDMFIKLRTMDPEERARQREYMLMYCGLDTYAMVKVYEALLSAAGL